MYNIVKELILRPHGIVAKPIINRKHIQAQLFHIISTYLSLGCSRQTNWTKNIWIDSIVYHYDI